VELDYLTAKRRFSTEYAYTIKSRLQKKLQLFASQELPLLVEQGYLTEFCKLTENNKVQQGIEHSLVKIRPHTGGLSLENSNHYTTKDKKKYGPKGIRTLDPRHVKAVS
jgi:hypothetical protein